MKIKLRNIIFILISFIHVNSYSQYLNCEFNISGYAFPNEPAIMINPKNTNQLVAGTNFFYVGTDTTISRYFYSTNGGVNWQSGLLFSVNSNPAGDPVIIVDTNGSFYFISLTNWGRTDWLDNLICQKSTNGGANWNEGTLFGYNNAKDMDKPWACVDLTHGIYGNNIYVTWTEFDKYGSRLATDSTHILFSKSTDNGNTFSVPKRINAQSGNCYDSTNTIEGAVPCIGVNGEIYVVWAGWTNLYFNKSTDGGDTWRTNERIVAQQVGGWKGMHPGITHGNGFPIISCDISNGLFRGNIYINWVDQRSGLSDQDVWIIKSTNGGENWSSPFKVNTDTTHRNQFFTWMTIDQKTGYIYCVFYDRRNSPTVMTDIYVARSTNGGNTFSDIKVNTNSMSMINSNIGDYINICAHNNKIRPVWISSINLINKAYTAIIDTFFTIGISQVNLEVPGNFSLSQNYPNPFNPETKIRFEIPSWEGWQTKSDGVGLVPLTNKVPGSLSRSNREGWQTKSDGVGLVTLTVYDALGREVETLVNEVLQPGTYEVTFSGSGYNSGVYFYRLMTDGFTETKRMLMIK